MLQAVPDTVPPVTNDAVGAALGDVVAVLESMYDPAWARAWDAVGLVTGDPDARVRRVLLAVDPSPVVVEEALAWHADLLITHHPLLLKPVHGVPATNAKGRTVHRLLKAGCALFTAHTNADAAAPGVSDALARVLGLTDLTPLSADPADPMDKIVTFAPEEATEAVIDALTAAGAGELGAYRRVAWTTSGIGTFVPGPEASPIRGQMGNQEELKEQRIEMVLPRARRQAVVAALHHIHPYQQPAFDVLEMAPWTGPRGIGRFGRLTSSTTLREFAMLVAEALPATAQGVRIAGDPQAEVTRVAVCGGSGDSLLPAVRACGADVYVTADLRHHPTSEFRDETGEGPPYLVDVAHWASEWPWLAGAANRLAGALEAAGTPIEVHVSFRTTDPWTFRVPSPGGVVR
jgi:dinuclear metal center YbgI/SA1388 family protein